MYVLKWLNSATRMAFDENNSGSGGDAGSGSASSGSSTPSSGGDSGAGSSAPSPDGEGGSSASPSPDSNAAPTGNEMDWAQLGSTDDLDFIEAPAVAPTATPAAVPPKRYGAAATPEPAPTPQAPVEPQAPAPVAAQPPSPTQPEPAAAAPTVQLSPSDPLGIATALEQNRDASIAHLASSRFALSQEDIAELEDNAAAFVPKMMARVHHEAQVSMMKFLHQAMPEMMKKFNTVTTANTEAEDQFFEANKALGLNKADKTHRAAAFSLAKIYRQANPDMPMEQLITDVGLMVATKLKLPMGQPAQQPAIPGNPQPTVVRPTGFRPAVNGGGGASPNPEPAGEWDGLGREFE